MPRPLWTGAVTFGLVSIPVKVVSAVGGEHAVRFYQLHAADHGRVRYRKVCELDGQELSADEIVRGYVAPDGRVAVVRDEELDDLPLPTAHTVEVSGFLKFGDIPATQLGKPYYLQAGTGGAKPYVLMREALARSGKAAVAKVALRGRESLVLVRAQDDVLVMHQLYWPDEINPADRVAPPSRVTVTDAELDAADALIDALGRADLDEMRDEYQDALQAVVTAKLDGQAPPSAPEPAAAPPLDLMAALRASLEAADAERAKPGGKKSTAAKPDAGAVRRGVGARGT